MTSGFRIVASTGIDQGDREYQQDQLLLTQHPRVKGCVLGVVADGMGGRSGGRKASDQVLLTAQQLLERYDPATDDAQAFLERIAREAHVVIRLTGASAEQEPHSTIAAFVLNPSGQLFVVHSGDSRVYLFNHGVLKQRTRDHSYVQSLVDRGQLTEDQAMTDPRGNLLLHCLGTENEPAVVTAAWGAMAAGHRILVCSDGLWHYFSTAELGRIVHELPARTATEFLVQKARQRADGQGDNLSLIVVQFDRLPAPVK